MLNMLLWALILVLSASLFEFSFCYGGIDRTFRGLNKAIPETCLVVDGAHAFPYFNKTYFQASVTSYFDEALANYAQSGAYELSFSYYMVDLGEISSGGNSSSAFSIGSFSAPKDSSLSLPRTLIPFSLFAPEEGPVLLLFPTGVRVYFSCPIGIWSHYSNYVDFFVRKGNKYGG
jgi:hypothetical protein